MIRAAIFLVFAALSLSAPRALSQELTPEQKASDLRQLVAQIKAGYGPLHYKRDLGIDIDALASRYLDQALASRTNGEFYYLVRKFVAEFHDSHFGALVPTTHEASVPFSTELVQGKVLIDEIDRAQLPTDRFPFYRGDEVLAIDGRPVAELLDELQALVQSGYAATARRTAAQLLTFRRGAVVPVPTGKASFQLRHGLSDIVDTVEVTWNERGEALDERAAAADGGGRRVLTVGARSGMRPLDFDLISTEAQGRDYLGNRAERTYRCNGTTRIQIPAGATVIMRSPFVAYYHPTEKGNVGYLRIPHYSWGPDAELRYAQYEYAISVLEENTVGLVIDQDHNCGGSVDFLEKLVGLFMNGNYSPMQFRLLSNKSQYLEYKSWMDVRYADTLEYRYAAKVLGLIRENWLAGEFMTPKTSIGGRTTLTPNAVHYTKPIVMLIDELSGSGGDAFPSLLQGYGRAKLLGTRTMGAGGHVEEQPPLYFSQVGTRMTKSLFFRPDGVPVENNGAVPDISYTTTRDDFMYGYRDYQRFYVSKLLELVGQR